MADSARWEGFEFREGDIVISTPPKCGTTWTQMICALLVFQTPDFHASLDLISPWLDMSLRKREDVVADLEKQEHRRIIKSHTPFDGLPYDERVTYICVGRDPRDVALSWDNHMNNVDFVEFLAQREAAVGLEDVAELMGEMKPPPEELSDRFWQWVDDDAPVENANSLKALLHHIASFWPESRWNNVVLLHYADMKADLGGQMRRLADRLGINVAEAEWPSLVEAATFANMKSRAEELVPNSSANIWKDKSQFLHKGTSGQWRELLTDDDMARYNDRVVHLAHPELTGWVHNGSLSA